MRIYLDTVAIIYLVEKIEPYNSTLIQRLNQDKIV